jgi:hypothetical protein
MAESEPRVTKELKITPTGRLVVSSDEFACRIKNALQAGIANGALPMGSVETLEGFVFTTVAWVAAGKPGQHINARDLTTPEFKDYAKRNMVELRGLAALALQNVEAQLRAEESEVN